MLSMFEVVHEVLAGEVVSRPNQFTLSKLPSTRNVHALGAVPDKLQSIE